MTSKTAEFRHGSGGGTKVYDLSQSFCAAVFCNVIPRLQIFNTRPLLSLCQDFVRFAQRHDQAQQLHILNWIGAWMFLR